MLSVGFIILLGFNFGLKMSVCTSGDPPSATPSSDDSSEKELFALQELCEQSTVG